MAKPKMVAMKKSSAAAKSVAVGRPKRMTLEQRIDAALRKTAREAAAQLKREGLTLPLSCVAARRIFTGGKNVCRAK